MSASTDDAMVECQPESSRSSLSAASNGPRQQSATNADAKDDRPNAPTEKTISCVSCRKRKLKCDRVKPKCSTCSRLRHECEYPERRRNLGSKRRNMKELEARLAQVETQLVAETSKGNATTQSTTVSSTEPDWNNFDMDLNIDMGNIEMLDQSFNVPLSGFDYQPDPNALPEGHYFSQELMSLGLSEPLPPQQMIDDLHCVYFEKFHPTMPMIHKYRYLAALNLPSHMQPPVCLRYAVWVTAASVAEKYIHYEDVLYERARKYIHEAEMKGHGEMFVTIQFAQAWGLIATYEAKKTFFTRAWMSTGRMTRLTQMLGLHRLDAEDQQAKRILPPAKDWVELEERRRVFWAAFYGDRWASSGTGWPMIIVENEIRTNLPSSEEAFYSGVPEETTPLSEALTPEGASKISPFGGVVLSACLFGHNFEHLHLTGPDERPDDLANGEFWKRHRRMDNVLSNTFMFLPDHLRLPGGLRDMNVVFLHMNIHTSSICLHQAAVLTAEKHNVAQSFINQSRMRCLMAAEEITDTMRLLSHLDVSNMNSWMGFCLYVAAGVFIQDQRGNEGKPQSITNLEFLLAAMKAIGNRHSITNHFTAQLEIDIESSGIQIKTNGNLPSGAANPNFPSDLHCLWEPAKTDGGSEGHLKAWRPYESSMAKGSTEVSARGTANPINSFPFLDVNPQELAREEGWPAADGVLPQMTDRIKEVVLLPPEGLRVKHVHPSYPNWDPPANSALSTPNFSTQPRQQQRHFFDAALPSPVIPAEPSLDDCAGSPFDIDSFLAANTPSSDSSSSNTMQMPYRQAGAKNPKFSKNSTFEGDPNSVIAAAGWTSISPYDDDRVNASDAPPIPREPLAANADRRLFGTAGWNDYHTPQGG